MSTLTSEHLFGVWDYSVIVAVLTLTIVIGLYHMWRARKSKNTRNFLVVSSGIGVIPLILSSVATVLSPIVFLGQPTELYNNGLQVALFAVVIFFSHLGVVYAIVPVYFRLNVSTVNQYIEYRFNRLLMCVMALLYILLSSITLASLAYLTALILSNATAISYWWSMALICGVCAIYTSLGGFSAVIWTDVLQVTVIAVSLIAIIIKGTSDVGGVTQIWNRNYEGNRTTLIRFSSDENTNYSIWSILFAGFPLTFGSVMTSQSALQRQMANSNLSKAKLTQMMTGIFQSLAHLMVCWIGMIIYARYYDCDPVINKKAYSRDQYTAQFAMEIFSGFDGLSGLYIAGILAATLSTLSSVLNGFSTMVVIDFVKPMFPSMKDHTTKTFSQIFGLIYGAAIVALTVIVSSFGGLIQMIYSIVGGSVGPIAGVFMLGFFFPWSTTKGASIGYICSFSLCQWAVFGRFFAAKQRKFFLPVRKDGCAVDIALNFFNHTITSLNQTSATNSSSIDQTSLAVQRHANHTAPALQSVDEIFALYRVPPLWYFTIAVMVVLIVGMLASLLTGAQDPEAIDPRLISPLSWYILDKLPARWRTMLGFKSAKRGDNTNPSIKCDDTNTLKEMEKEALKPNIDVEESKEISTII